MAQRAEDMIPGKCRMKEQENTLEFAPHAPQHGEELALSRAPAVDAKGRLVFGRS
jgi:hypothetical protein